jgi:hypothetical protein
VVLCFIAIVIFVTSFWLGVQVRWDQGEIAGDAMRVIRTDLHVVGGMIWWTRSDGRGRLTAEVRKNNAEGLARLTSTSGIREVRWLTGEDLRWRPLMGGLGVLSIGPRDWWKEKDRDVTARPALAGMRLYLVVVMLAMLPVLRWGVGRRAK